jgi:hypothetical protein
MLARVREHPLPTLSRPLPTLHRLRGRDREGAGDGREGES